MLNSRNGEFIPQYMWKLQVNSTCLKALQLLGSGNCQQIWATGITGLFFGQRQNVKFFITNWLTEYVPKFKKKKKKIGRSSSLHFSYNRLDTSNVSPIQHLTLPTLPHKKAKYNILTAIKLFVIGMWQWEERTPNTMWRPFWNRPSTHEEE